MGRRAVRIVAVAASVFVVVTAIVLLISVVSDMKTNVMDLTVGQCFNADLRSDEITNVDTVECATAHVAEVIQRGELNPNHDREYPDDTTLFDESDAACRQTQPMLSEGFSMVAIPANEAAWEPTAGRYICLAIPAGLIPTSGTALSATAD